MLEVWMFPVQKILKVATLVAELLDVDVVAVALAVVVAGAVDVFKP